MPEPTLALTHDQFAAKLGVFSGWGQGAYIDGVATGDPAWSSYQKAVIEDSIQSGLRRFYYPDPAGGPMHSWTFLKPVATLILASGGNTIQLPDDYGECEGVVTINPAATQSQPWEIAWRNESQIRQMYALTNTVTGPPMYVAEQVLKGTTPINGQRKQLYLYPNADQQYTLNVAYYVNPDYLTQAAPYAYGGAQHAETILESCLAVMEERVDDIKDGPHAKSFAERMRASIALDSRSQPQRLGPNLDRSDWTLGVNRANVHYSAPAATYNGGAFS